MINLLLPEEARAVNRDYYRRIWTVAGMLVLATTIIILIVIGSLYWFTNIRLTDAKQALAVSKQAFAQNDLDQLLEEIKITNERLKRLASSVDLPGLLPSEILTKIIDSRGQVTLQKINYLAGADSTKVSLAGRSSTRTEFLKYLETLRQLPFIAQVHSPVKNLIQEKNLSFTLELTLK